MADVSTFCAELEEHRDEIESANKEGGSTYIVASMRRSLDTWKETTLNIGVTGRSGVGKSSFINTIRGLTADSPGAAETGISETTAMAMPYPHPENEKLKFWDLPGLGTPKFPREKYFNDKRVQFEKYDMFLILSMKRLYEEDYLLAEEAKKQKKPFLFIRTNVDVDVASQKRSKSSEFKNDPHATERAIRENVETSLRDRSLYREDSVFLIDCLDMTWTMYDFEKLISRLIDGFPDLQREVFILSLNILQPHVIRQKTELLRKRIWKVSLISAAGAVVPLPGLSCAVDVSSILEEAFVYMEQLEISKLHVEKAAVKCNEDFEKLTEKLDLRSVHESWTSHGLATYMAKIILAEAAENAIKFTIPGIGSAIAACISFRTTYQSLSDILSMLESDAKRLNAHMHSIESSV